jgi:hypothetical protein
MYGIVRFREKMCTVCTVILDYIYVRYCTVIIDHLLIKQEVEIHSETVFLSVKNCKISGLRPHFITYLTVNI